MEAYFMEKMNMKALLGDGHALTGDRVSMKDVKRCIFAVAVEAGSTETAFALTLRQHDAATAGTSKDLSVDNKYYKKIGATTVFTQVSPAVAAAAYDLQAEVLDQVAFVVFEVLPEQLDHVNGFDWCSIDVSGAGVGTRAAAIYSIVNDNFKPSYGNAL